MDSLPGTHLQASTAWRPESPSPGRHASSQVGRGYISLGSQKITSLQTVMTPSFD